MKSAEEWIDLVDNNKIEGNPQTEESTNCCITNAFEIEQIQLDAYRAGMTEAAEIASNKAIRFDGVMPLDGFETKKVIVHTILSARDKKEKT